MQSSNSGSRARLPDRVGNPITVKIYIERDRLAACRRQGRNSSLLCLQTTCQPAILCVVQGGQRSHPDAHHHLARPAPNRPHPP